jgi:hypothetical protein
MKKGDYPVPPFLEGPGQEKALDGATPGDAGVGEKLDDVKGIHSSPLEKSRPSVISSKYIRI